MGVYKSIMGFLDIFTRKKPRRLFHFQLSGINDQFHDELNTLLLSCEELPELKSLAKEIHRFLRANTHQFFRWNELYQQGTETRVDTQSGVNINRLFSSCQIVDERHFVHGYPDPKPYNRDNVYPTYHRFSYPTEEEHASEIELNICHLNKKSNIDCSLETLIAENDQSPLSKISIHTAKLYELVIDREKERWKYAKNLKRVDVLQTLNAMKKKL